MPGLARCPTLHQQKSLCIFSSTNTSPRHSDKRAIALLVDLLHATSRWTEIAWGKREENRSGLNLYRQLGELVFLGATLPTAAMELIRGFLESAPRTQVRRTAAAVVPRHLWVHDR